MAIALILWYRMRKARMLNETMLKLAEKGIVPSADAIDALTGGNQPAAMAITSVSPPGTVDSPSTPLIPQATTVPSRLSARL